jgi:hypothetical protein
MIFTFRLTKYFVNIIIIQSFDTRAVSSNFFQNFHFVYLFRAALYGFLLELSKARCFIDQLYKPLLALDSILHFMQLGLNDADAIKSSSVLIYYNSEQSIDTRNSGSMPIVIKRGQSILSRQVAEEEIEKVNY